MHAQAYPQLSRQRGVVSAPGSVAELPNESPFSPT